MPVHVNENVTVVVRGPKSSDPAVARAPLQPSEAVQLVALVVVHDKVAVPVAGTLVEVAFSVTVGGGTTVTVND